MSLTPGTRLGPYSVTAKIGQGGMGEVWQARDTKLDRDVALKVLPEAFTSDPDRLARFEREAKVLASLNHPNIGSIYGLEEAEGVRALVLELVEGPTLADRIKLGPIPIDEALPIARQIAEALEAAHEAGVTHRDLKPANIKVREDGTVKVLDFGLAKALEGVPGSDPSQSPTLTVAATQMGVIMGTAAYMAPEQAKGKVADKRADVWAFGVVLYEMLTGRRAFEGGDISEVMAGVIKSEPDWDALPTALPPALVTYLRRCVQKDPRERIRDIGDVRLALAGAFDPSALPPVEPPVTTVAVPQLALWQRPAGIAAVVLVAIVLGGLIDRALVPSAPTQATSRAAISVAPSRPVAQTTFSPDVAISPDGRRIVYQAGAGLDVRLLDQLESVALRGLEVGFSPFVSPDGAWIGFASGNLLQRVSSVGGPPVTICTVPASLRGASWGPDDVIVFGVGAVDGLWQVPMVGGEPTRLTRDEGASHRFPDVLPNGAGVLFTTSTGSTDFKISVLDRATGEHRVIIETGSFPRYAHSGHVVYAIEGVLYAVAFDQETLEVTGDPVPVVENVVTKSSGAASFDLSDTGALVYVNGTAGGNARQFVWVDQEGRQEVLPLPARTYFDPRVSPDGRRVAVTVVADQGQDVWVYDAVSAAGLRLTQGFAVRTLVWTPDGSRIIFYSAHESVGDIYSVSADGSGQPEVVLASDAADFPTSVTPDGRTVVFSRFPDGVGTPHREIWEVALDGSEPPVPLLQGVFARGNAEYSPDGNWLVYRSDQSGEMEVYVQPYPGPGPVVPASIGGGNDVMWAPDGSRLFYRLDDQMMAVTFASGDSVRIGSPTAIFAGTYFAQPNGVRQHHVAPDGRFLMMRDALPDASDAQIPTQVVLVQNWFEELKARVPVP